VERRLRAFIGKQFPEAGFLGEETGASGPEASGTRFIVDPIDGTRAFIRGLPTWSILVGIEHDGEPVVGVALMPAAGDLFVGIRGIGSHANGRPVRLSTVATLADATVSHGGLAQFTDAKLAGALPKLADGTFTQRGFADFDGYRQLLLGRVDAMIDPGTTPWDLCAPAALTRAAGGRFTSVDGEESIYGGGAVASNGLVHDALVELLR
jgi:histidinol-phosphatase